MRILMVNKYYRMVGGVERHVRDLTRVLESRGHEVIPFAMSHAHNDPTPYAPYFVSGIDLLDGEHRPPPWVVAERAVYSREAHRKMARLIEVVRPDVAHVHNIYHHISPSVLDALASQGIPIVMTLHDYKLICPVYTLWSSGAPCERCRGRFYFHCLVHRCNHGSVAASALGAVEGYIHRLTGAYDHVGRFVAPSKFLLLKHVQYGMPPDRIVHIPNFVAVDTSPTCDERGRQIVYAGRLTPFKGVETLLEAMAEGGIQNPLVIAGDGPCRHDLERRAGQLGLQHVRFVGHQSFPQLAALIARAQFVVVPSEWYENCPYAILEAYALSTPVLATAVGGIPELLDDGVEGMLVPPSDVAALADGIQRMLGVGPRLAEMGRAGRERIEAKHAQEQYIAALSRVYMSVGARAL